jgi:hypothetical protein
LNQLQIYKNIQNHIEESDVIEKNPKAFMMKEISKVGERLLVDKKKEMRDIIDKLDDIFFILNKKK